MKIALSSLLGLLACSFGSLAFAQEKLSPLNAATVELDSRDQAPFRRMVDFDLDGDLDAIGILAAEDPSTRYFRVAAYENLGKGAFHQVWYYDGTAAVLGGPIVLLIEVARLDADPYPDICVMYRGHRFDFLGQGNGQFSYAITTAVPVPALAMALSDLDGDGSADWIWAGDWYDLDEYRTLYVTLTTGGTAELGHGVNLARSIHVLPQDGPIGSDLILISGTTEVQVFYRHPTSGVLTAGPYFVHGLLDAMCDTGDIDGDGDIDAVLFHGAGGYRVLRRTAPAAWALEPLQFGGPAEFLVDVDQDGDLDGACCGGGGGPCCFPDVLQPSDFQISLNDGTGVFAPVFKIPGVGSTQLAGAVDIDGDGDVDLVAGRCVYFASGPIAPVDAPGAVVPTWRGPRDLSDCDGDGDVDVGFSLNKVFQNDGAGGFTSDAPHVAPAPPGTAYRGPGFPGDWDGDGDQDLLVELRLHKIRQANHQGGELLGMTMLENDGAGALAFGGLAGGPGVGFALGSLEAEASLAVDPDRDGDLDLATRTMNGPGGGPGDGPVASRRWTNDGNGHFVLYAAWNGKRIEWDGDYDLDGDNDLLVSSPRGEFSRLDLYLGQSTGFVLNWTLDDAFTQDLWNFDPLGAGLAVGDFVRDGFPDFALAAIWVVPTGGPAIGSYDAALHNNYRGGGTLELLPSASAYGLRVGARSSVGDLDGDGLDDILVGAHSGELVTVSEVQIKKANGAGYPAFDYTRQLVPPGLVVDLDGDGDLDVLGERIVFNRTSP